MPEMDMSAQQQALKTALKVNSSTQLLEYATTADIHAQHAQALPHSVHPAWPRLLFVMVFALVTTVALLEATPPQLAASLALQNVPLALMLILVLHVLVDSLTLELMVSKFNQMLL